MSWNILVLDTSVPVGNIQIMDTVSYVSEDKTGNVFVNVIFRWVREVSIAVETQYLFLVFVRNLIYPAFKVHAHYYIAISDQSGSIIFSTSSHK